MLKWNTKHVFKVAILLVALSNNIARSMSHSVTIWRNVSVASFCAPDNETYLWSQILFYCKITNTPGHQLSTVLTMTAFISLVCSTPVVISNFLLNQPFLVDWRPLVKERVAYFGRPSHIFSSSSVSIINRLGVARAVLQTPPNIYYLSYPLWKYIPYTVFPKP